VENLLKVDRREIKSDVIIVQCDKKKKIMGEKTKFCKGWCYYLSR